MKVSDLKGQVDFAIITMRDDEFSAVLKRFPADYIAEGEREYNISVVPYSNSEQYLVAVTRCPQGNSQSQAIASDIIRDLDPQWLVLVGIAGAVPEYEFTLGDVIIARKLADFTVGAAIYPNKQEWAGGGGWMAESVGRIVDNLIARPELEGWNNEDSIGIKRPPVDLKEENFIGSDDWKKKVKKILEYHFGSQSQLRLPKPTTATIASSGDLIKDSNLVEQWLNTARDLKAVEMELPGVYTAARTRYREYPVLAIRGISDIVGFKRDPGWTRYACESAAAFANAFIKQRKPIEPRKKKHRPKSTSQTPWKSMVKILDSNGNTVGSGFMIHPDGYFITCHQVIYNLDSIKVKYQEEKYSATWREEFSNPEVDIAILKIDVENAKTIPISIPKDQMVSALVYGFTQKQGTQFSKDFDVYETLKKNYTVNTISTYDKTIDLEFANSWNKKPQEQSTFFAYKINEGKNDGIDQGICGGIFLDEDSNCVIGVFQSSQQSESYIISWENIIERLKLLQIDPERRETFSTVTLRNLSTSSTATSSNIYLPKPGYRTFLGREKKIETIKEVLSDTQRETIIGVDGFGGIGKTALVQEIIKSYSNIGFDKVIWKTASTTDNSEQEQMSFETVLDAITIQLNRPDLFKLKRKEREIKTRELLHEQQVLIVLDNMETSAEPQNEIIQKLLPILGSSKALLTSRRRFTESFEDNLFPIHLRGLEQKAARALIEDIAIQKNMRRLFDSLDDRQLDKLIKITGDEIFGYTPMALKFILGQYEKFELDFIIRTLQGVRLTDEQGQISEDDEFRQFWKYICLNSAKLLSDFGKKFMLGMHNFEPNIGSNHTRIMEVTELNDSEFSQAVTNTWKLSFLEIHSEGSNKTYYQHTISYIFMSLIIPLLEKQ